MTRIGDLPLRGAGGEPVDFARTIVSHGVAELPPNHVDLAGRSFETTLLVPGGARTVRVTESGGKLRIDVVSGRVGVKSRDALAAIVAQMFRLDEELSGFYAVISADGDLSGCATGAGRMLRAPTVFEDVVKTICTLIQPYTTNRAYEDLVRTHSRKASNRVALHSVRWPSSRRSGSSCGRWSPTT